MTDRLAQIDQEIAELLQKQQAICDNPANANKAGGIFLYTKRARAKLDKISRDIADRTREKRLLKGETVDDSGYSGRQTNRR